MKSTHFNHFIIAGVVAMAAAGLVSVNGSTLAQDGTGGGTSIVGPQGMKSFGPSPVGLKPIDRDSQQDPRDFPSKLMNGGGQFGQGFLMPVNQGMMHAAPMGMPGGFGQGSGNMDELKMPTAGPSQAVQQKRLQKKIDQLKKRQALLETRITRIQDQITKTQAKLDATTDEEKQMKYQDIIDGLNDKLDMTNNLLDDVTAAIEQMSTSLSGEATNSAQ